MTEIRIEKGGRLALPLKVARVLGNQSLRLSACSAHHLLLESAANDDKVQMTGLIDASGVVDLLSFFNMFRKSGLLYFNLPGGSKAPVSRKERLFMPRALFPKKRLVKFSIALVSLTGKFYRALASLPEVPCRLVKA